MVRKTCKIASILCMYGVLNSGIVLWPFVVAISFLMCESIRITVRCFGI